MSQHSDTLKICERNNGRRFKLVFFVVATATTILQLKSSSNNGDTVKSEPSFFVLRLEKVVLREGNCEGDRKLRADLA